MREELDRLLYEYLLQEKSDPIRKRLESQANWSIEHERQDAERHTEVMRVLDGHHYRITSLERDASELKKDVEDTKDHDLEELRRKLAEKERERRESGRPGKGLKLPKWLSKTLFHLILAGLGGGGAGALLRHLLGH